MSFLNIFSMLFGRNESGMFARSASAEILERARSNLLDAVQRGSNAPLPRPGWRWETYALRSREKAMEFCTPMEAIHFAQSPDHHGGFESRQSSARIRDLAAVEERYFAKEFPQFADHVSSFRESPLSAPPTVAVFRKRLVSSPLYSHVRFILRCLCYCRPERVCEIGGGYGGPARLWMTNAAHRPRQYWIVDLPESLFFADVYLKVHFGIGDVLYIASPDDVVRAVGNGTQGAPRFVLCPVHNLPHIAQVRFDLVTNTLSMQEMSEEYVDFYMRWLDQQPCRFFYSFNYAVQSVERIEESMNVAAPRLSRRWVTRFIRHTGETPYAFGEILAEKCGGDAGIPYEEIAGRRRRYVDGRLRPDAFFDLLDCARSSDDVREVWSLVKRAVNELEYVPKEVVHLLRRLQQMDAAVLPEADRIALTGLQQVFGKRVVGVGVGSGKVVLADPVLAKEVGSRLRGGWTGTLAAEGAGENLVINEKAAKVSDGFYGSIEHLAFEGEALVVSGWAADTQSRRPVSKVVCFAGGSLVAVTELWIERPDVAREFGVRLSRPGFRLRLPGSVVGPIDSSTVRCFALVAEGIAGELRRPAGRAAKNESAAG